MVYVLLTYGAKPSGSIGTHPAAKSQLRFLKKFMAEMEIQDGSLVYDLARSANSLDALPNLKRLLIRLKDAGKRKAVVDDIARLIKIADLNHREDLFKELQEYGSWIVSLKHQKSLSDFSVYEIEALTEHAEISKHPGKQRRSKNTEEARRSSMHSRSTIAVRSAQSLADLRKELNAVQGRATLQEISDEANMRGLKTSRGKNWTPQNVARALKLLEENEDAAH